MHELPTGECQWPLYAALREAGADITVRNHEGLTPLHCATAAGDLHLVRLLLMDGAAADAEGARFETPMHLAAAVQDVEVVPALIQCLAQNGAHAGAHDEYGVTPLDIAWSRGPDGQPVVVSFIFPTPFYFFLLFFFVILVFVAATGGVISQV